MSRCLKKMRFKILSSWRINQTLCKISAPLLADTVIISGFWRSGTTWLQQQVAESLNAKTIFEPYSPASGHNWSQVPEDNPDANKHVFMPLSLDMLSERDQNVLTDACKGIGRHGFAYFLYKNHTDALRKSLVLKFTRIGFLLPELASEISTPIIHIRRHPGSVFASFKNTDWDWKFEEVNLTKLFQTDNQSASDSDQAMIEKLREHDRSPATRFAALWGLSEKRAQEAIDAKQIALVDYNDLVDGEVKMDSILREMGLKASAIAETKSASPVTTADRTQLTAKERKHDWTKRLTDQEIRDIHDTLADVFPYAINAYMDDKSSS